MATELKKVNEYSLTDLIMIRDHFDNQFPGFPQPEDLNEQQKQCVIERDELDKYILKKWQYIRQQSLPVKKA